MHKAYTRRWALQIIQGYQEKHPLLSPFCQKIGLSKENLIQILLSKDHHGWNRIKTAIRHLEWEAYCEWESPIGHYTSIRISDLYYPEQQNLFT